MMKKYQVTVSKKMHGVLEDGARRTNMSMAEFADHVLRSKVEEGLPLLAENPGEHRLMLRAGKTEKDDWMSPDGNYQLLEHLGMWQRIKQS